MKHRSEKWERLIALFVVGFTALNFPILALFDADYEILGVPALHLYLFTVWILLIFIAAWIIERR